MNRKLLFFDIDGTLLNEADSSIPESTIYAIKRAQELGHYTFINTGRAQCLVPRALRRLGFDGYLCGCGTHITLHDQLLMDKEFDQKRGIQMALRGRELGMSVIYEGNKAGYYDGLTAFSEENKQVFTTTFAEFSDLLKDFNQCPDFQFSKACTFADTKDIFLNFIEPFSDYFEYIERGGTFYEITPIGYSKAKAIDIVLEHLGQSLEDCYVFGDSNNDLSMLTHVKHSIAMGNSSPAVLQAASYVTTPVWRDGIYVAMKHFELI